PELARITSRHGEVEVARWQLHLRKRAATEALQSGCGTHPDGTLPIFQYRHSPCRRHVIQAWPDRPRPLAYRMQGGGIGMCRPADTDVRAAGCPDAAVLIEHVRMRIVLRRNLHPAWPRCAGEVEHDRILHVVQPDLPIGSQPQFAVATG